MRVCLISAEYPPLVGGVADHTRHLARSLVLLGVEVAVLTTRSSASGGMGDPRETSPATVDERFQILAAISRWDFRLFGEVRRALACLRPDIAHIQYQTAAYGMHPAINLLPRRLRSSEPGTPFVTTLHDLRQPYLFPKAGPLRRWVTRQLITHSQGIVATNPEDTAATQQVLEGLHAHGGRRPPHLALIPNGPNILPEPITPAGCQEVRAKWGVPPNAQVIGHFGLLNHTKGVESLLRALRILLDRGLEVVLVQVGEEVGKSDPTNRANQARLRRMAHELSLGRHIVWTGYLPPEELSRSLQALDCCLLPYNDGASYRRTTLLTALAHGLPVVTTSSSQHQSALVKGEAELPSLRDGEHCRLVPPGDAALLAAATEELLSNPALRERLGRGATALAGQFSWDAIAQRTAAFYQEVVASSPSRQN